MKRYVLGPNAARKLKALLAKSDGVSRRPAGSAAVVSDLEYAAPFTVQWAASVGSGGAWIIWLPGDELVSVDGVTCDPTDGMDDVGGDYPEGWYLLDGDALDPDAGGKLYLNMTVTEAVQTCSFASAPQTSGVNGSHSVAICESSVDSETGARSVKQFVTSSIIIASGGGGDKDEYCADGKSISQKASSSTDPTQMVDTNVFHIQGFGKFRRPGYTAPLGTYQAPSTLTLNFGQETGVAFLVRSGNSDQPDSNFIGYSKIKIQNVPSQSYKVLTDVKLELDGSGQVPRLVLKKYYGQVNVLGTGNSTQDSDSVELVPIDVVVGSSYSTSSKDFVNILNKLFVMGVNQQQQRSDPVFTATPHSAE